MSARQGSWFRLASLLVRPSRESHSIWRAKPSSGSSRTLASKLLLGVAVLFLASIATFASAETVTYVYSDPQGTPLAEADASGTITATFDYRPYGAQVSGAPKNGPGYTGHVNDADSGFVYMQARYYDPVVARFLSTDPVGLMPGNTYNFNRFSYADNNPILNIDADGRETGIAFQAVNKWTTQPYTVGSAGGDVEAIADAIETVDQFLAPLGPEGGAEFHAAAAPLVALFREVKVAASVERVATGIKEGAAAEKAANAAGAAAKIQKAGAAATQGPRYARGELRQQVLNKGRQADGTIKCAYCSKPTASQADHVVPYSKGGSTTIDNLAPACPSCNASKGAKNLGDEWIPPKDRE